mmetsp:Transcript_5764/g.15612  ORF Transcript_5764/g.15612 Transcript_5764/m.15612 type:complete len:358 (-) Transcript_5764:48-1121(-)
MRRRGIGMLRLSIPRVGMRRSGCTAPAGRVIVIALRCGFVGFLLGELIDVIGIQEAVLLLVAVVVVHGFLLVGMLILIQNLLTEPKCAGCEATAEDAKHDDRREDEQESLPRRAILPPVILFGFLRLAGRFLGAFDTEGQNDLGTAGIATIAADQLQIPAVVVVDPQRIERPVLQGDIGNDLHDPIFGIVKERPLQLRLHRAHFAARHAGQQRHARFLLRFDEGLSFAGVRLVANERHGVDGTHEDVAVLREEAGRDAELHVVADGLLRDRIDLLVVRVAFVQQGVDAQRRGLEVAWVRLIVRFVLNAGDGAMIVVAAADIEGDRKGGACHDGCGCGSRTSNQRRSHYCSAEMANVM